MEEKIIKTGFKELDNIIDLEKSNLIVLASRSAMGKSTMALNIIKNIAIKEKMPVLYFNLESSKEWIMNKLNCNNIEESELYIEDEAGISVYKICEIAKRLKNEKNIKFIVIDYFQLIKCDDIKLSGKQKMSKISLKLKELSMKLKIPILLVSQLSREPEKRENHRPILSDLNYSGAIIQDADLVMLLYREDYYNSESTNKNITEVIIAKNRYGECKTINFKTNDEYFSFE